MKHFEIGKTYRKNVNLGNGEIVKDYEVVINSIRKARKYKYADAIVNGENVELRVNEENGQQWVYLGVCALLFA